jgi:hypothetical protein
MKIEFILCESERLPFDVSMRSAWCGKGKYICILRLGVGADRGRWELRVG